MWPDTPGKCACGIAAIQWHVGETVTSGRLLRQHDLLVMDTWISSQFLVFAFDAQ